jgi:hypothetical protein
MQALLIIFFIKSAFKKEEKSRLFYVVHSKLPVGSKGNPNKNNLKRGLAGPAKTSRNKAGKPPVLCLNGVGKTGCSGRVATASGMILKLS